MFEAFPVYLLEELAGDWKGAIKIGPFGSQLKKEEMVAVGYKVYGQENVIADDWNEGDRRITKSKFNSLSSCELKAGDVVLSMMGTVGKCSIFPSSAEKGVMDSHLLRIQVNAKLVTREYLSVLLQAQNIVGKQVATKSHGSIMAGLSSSIVRSFELQVPPLEEQPIITDILDTLDTQIRQTEAIIAKLQQVKQGLLHDLLTRGIDANGQLRPPREQALELYKESPLGWIPREWEATELVDLLADVDPPMRSGPFGSALLKSELVEMGIPLLGIDNVHVEVFRPDFRRYVTPEKFEELKRYSVRPNDIMITIMGTVGRCCLVPQNTGNALSSKHTWTITLDQSVYRPYLAMLQINYAPWVLRHFSADEQGGTMSAIRSDTLRKTRLPVPQIEEQVLIENRLQAITARIQNERAEYEKLKLEKSGLMDDLLTGRVRVTELTQRQLAS